MKNRMFYLDVLRCLAILLVVYCHFVSVGSGWNKIPDVIKISDSVTMPLLKANVLTHFDTFLKNHFSTCAGTLGVCLFFLMSGFLVPIMLERHNRFTFFVNRIVRIFPVMWVCLAISGLFIFLTNGITFSAGDYLSNMFLIKTTIGGSMRWMLPMEVIFYFVAVIIGKFDFKKALISVLSIMLFMAYVAYVVFGGSYDLDNRHPILHHICFILQFIPIIFIGTSIYISKQYKNILAKIICVSFFTSLAYLSLNLSCQYFDLGTNILTYGNLWTYLIILGLWYVVYFIFEFGKVKLGSVLENIIEWVSQTGYPFYLLHLAIGLTLIEKIRFTFNNSYLILTVALFFALLVSRLVYLYVEVPVISVGKRLKKMCEDQKK
ncbi:acyltransferase [Endomicrobiia bacterium]|nr:acyltransferase [Endomicrobiia bacterium]